MSGRWAHFRQHYGAHAILGVAVVLAIIVPADMRASAWSWLLKGLNVMDVIVVVGTFRLMSNVEHRRTLMKIAGIGDKLENGIKARLDAIERHLNIAKDE